MSIISLLPPIICRIPLRKIPLGSDMHPVERYSKVLKALMRKYSSQLGVATNVEGTPEPLTNYLDVSFLACRLRSCIIEKLGWCD